MTLSPFRNLFASSYIEKHFSEEGTELFINTSNHVSNADIVNLYVFNDNLLVNKH